MFKKTHKKTQVSYDIHLTYFSSLATLQLMSSADGFCKQFGPDQARQNVRPDLIQTVEASSFYVKK